MYLRRLLLSEFIRPGDVAQSYPECPEAFKVCCISASADPLDAEIIAWLRELQAKERSPFMSGMSTLLKLANAGRKLESHFGAKECHQTHRFTYKQQEHIVWRIRRGDLRILFYYCSDRILLLTDTFPKHRDKLTLAQKKKSEQIIKDFIDAKQIQFTQDIQK